MRKSNEAMCEERIHRTGRETPCAGKDNSCTVTLKEDREKERCVGVAEMEEKMKGRALGSRERRGGDREGRRERDREEGNKKENHLN